MSDQNLTPTQDLIVEVLAARWRTGESVWTFSSRHAKAIKGLDALGLTRSKSGVVEKTRLVRLTEAGRDYALDPDYTPPGVVRRISLPPCKCPTCEVRRVYE